MYTLSSTFSGWSNALTLLRADGYTGPAIVGSLSVSNQSATAAYLHLTQNGATNPTTAADGFIFSTAGTPVITRYGVDLASTWINTAGSIAIRLQVTSHVTTLDVRPYRVYTALLTQTGTDDPTATVLENSIGNIVWTRTGVGQYSGTLAGAFPATQTFIATPVTHVTDTAVRVFRNDDDVIRAYSADGDDELLTTSVEIRVYN